MRLISFRNVLLGVAFSVINFISAREAPLSPDDLVGKLDALPGFKIEHVLTADRKSRSWICLAKDPKGRLLLGAQNGQKVTRITLENGKVTKEEELDLPLSETMGMLYVGDTLYVDGHGKDKGDKPVFGLFACKDTTGSDRFDSIEFLREWEHGAGEHGAHGLVLGPDKKLYTVAGNFTGLPADLLPSSPHRNYADDLIIPRAEDGNGFGAGKKPPGGFICRYDLDGKNPELFASGQRNTYDIAFNADGELFGFDSDMEYDWGTPWYRPIRVYHATSGADQGFREGTAKWPEYYADSLPAVVNIGIGCPTGVGFGYGAKFPSKYQKAFYVLDWTYGRLIAVHLKPNGSTYSADWENFVAPKSLKELAGKTPLNLTDVIIGNDGALYFTVGGRGTEPHLFRVTWEGKAVSTILSDKELHDTEGEQARAERHALEAFHGKVDPKALEAAWPALKSADRFIRYAARLAIESQPVAQWKDRALAEKDPQAALVALLALARLGDDAAQTPLMQNLAGIPLANLTPAQQLEKLRTIEVSLSRHPLVAQAAVKPLLEELAAAYPAKSLELNRELCQIELAVKAPDAVTKTVALLKAAPTQEEQFTYGVHLRQATVGWTPEARKDYLNWFVSLQKTKTEERKHPDYVTQWFADAGRAYSDGASFPRFHSNFHQEAVNLLPPSDAVALNDVIAAYKPAAPKAPKKPAKARKLVKEWQIADLQGSLDEVGKGRNFERGREIFETASCSQCHRFDNAGGAVGPDLTTVATRFKRQDILESIIEPSKVISEQFMDTQVKTKDGVVIVGRVVGENDKTLILQKDMLKPETRTEIKKDDIKVRALSKISPMPVGAMNNYTKEEILDLIAYLESAGRKDHPDFAK